MNNKFIPIKDMFEKAIGGPVDVIDTLNSNNREVFIGLIQTLQDAYFREEKLYEESKIDISMFTSPLWDSLEGCLTLIWGDDACDVIIHYLNNIYDESTQGVRWLNEEEDKVYVFKNPNDLWVYISNFYLNKQ